MLSSIKSKVETYLIYTKCSYLFIMGVAPHCYQAKAFKYPLNEKIISLWLVIWGKQFIFVFEVFTFLKLIGMGSPYQKRKLYIKTYF
ncbi:hypothetical protein CN617_20665 [Bacillus wiedmannii]|nr:hypothetical protein CN617_20665 [Bacillus wiedmannii]